MKLKQRKIIEKINQLKRYSLKGSVQPGKPLSIQVKENREDTNNQY